MTSALPLRLTALAELESTCKVFTTLSTALPETVNAPLAVWFKTYTSPVSDTTEGCVTDQLPAT